MGAPVVAVGERAESFLARGVEEVELVGFPVDGEFLALCAAGGLVRHFSSIPARQE